MFLPTSLLLFGASYNRFKNIKWILYVLLMAYSVYMTNFSYGILFPMVNLFAIGSVPLLLHLTKKANSFISIFAILFWSILIDTLTFILIPEFTMGVPLLQYIAAGIAFNINNMYLPIAIGITVVSIDHSIAHYKQVLN